MEFPVFSVGVAPSRPRRTLKKKRKIIKQAVHASFLHFDLGRPLHTWLLLPERMTSAFQRIALDKVFPTLNDSLLAFREFKNQYPEDSFQFKLAQNVYDIHDNYETVLASIRTMSALNKKVRFQFKRLLLLYRIRNCKLVNTEDIVTLEPIKKPVRVYDLKQKKIYMFEARSLINDSVHRLLYHEELFLIPKEPRNLLTNQAFTYPQLLSIHTQMTSQGVTHWLWECFAHSSFSTAQLARKHEMPIHLHIFDTLIKKGTDYVIHDIVVDFIQSEYDFHKRAAPPDTVLYTLLKVHWNHPFMSQWIRECRNSWDLRLRKIGDLKKEMVHVRTQTQTLVKHSSHLIQLYKSLLSK